MSQFADPDGWLDRQDMVAGRGGSGVGEGGAGKQGRGILCDAFQERVKSFAVSMARAKNDRCPPW